MQAAGATLRLIADELNRAPSTISRELSRNTTPNPGYQPHAAHRAAAARRQRPKDGKLSAEAIATLVERIRYVTLVHLPGDHTAETVRDGLIATMSALPARLRGSLTWDKGAEMAGHKSFSMATDMQVYFCGAASPWQRGSNEIANGLLRQYFPKGTDLSV